MERAMERREAEARDLHSILQELHAQRMGHGRNDMRAAWIGGGTPVGPSPDAHRPSSAVDEKARGEQRQLARLQAAHDHELAKVKFEREILEERVRLNQARAE